MLGLGEENNKIQNMRIGTSWKRVEETGLRYENLTIQRISCRTE